MRTLLVLISFAVSGCSGSYFEPTALARYRWQKLNEEVQSVVVDISDGVSRAEAYQLGRAYFAAAVGVGTGMLYYPKEEPAAWRFPIGESYHGAHVGDVVVQKIDGKCSIEGAIAAAVKVPNKAPEPTPLPVTPPAEPGVAPGSGVAHL